MGHFKFPFRTRSSFRTAGKRRKMLSLHLEKLEDRHLMDGVGFVHTDPAPDPDSVVGEARIEARDDYILISEATRQLRIDVLNNDPLPEATAKLRIKSVSETARGAIVTISDDGLRLVYTPPADGVRSDSFYYIVEDDAGNLGKANVTVRQEVGRPAPPILQYDRFYALEDGDEQVLDVLRNDGLFRDGEIIEVTSPKLGTARIADDGKTLLYQPNAATTGYDRFRYTVRSSDGEIASASVSVLIRKPYQIKIDGDGRSSTFALDIGTGPYELPLLANDQVLAPTPERPRIVEITFPEYVGQLQISEDGQSVNFTPAEEFLGSFGYSYSVQYGPLAHQTTSGSGSIRVQNTFLAVDNWLAVAADSAEGELDVLANDAILQRRSGDWRIELPDVTLTIVEVTGGNAGGAVTIADDGKSLRYTPAAGFIGQEILTYTVEDSNGHRDSAVVTVHVAQGVTDPHGLPKFTLPGELEQYLIDQAVEKYGSQFGVTSLNYTYKNPGIIPEGDAGFRFASAAPASSNYLSTTADRSYSETNTQEAGVDEADIVETDGDFLYTFSNGKLAIVDLADFSNPKLVALLQFEANFTEMYLQGDRITLIDRGSYRDGKSNATIAVLDISDRTDPIVVERTEIDARIVDTRAVGDSVYVVVSGIGLPKLENHVVQLEETEIRTNETLDEYVARVRSTLLQTSLPMFQTYDAANQLVRSGLLTDPADIHKPVDAVDNSLLSLVTFDVGNQQLGPVSSVGIFTSSSSEVYMSGDSIYVLRNYGGETAIFKFDVAEDGSSELVATGKVGGTLLNQFSVDEYDDRLRIATTQIVKETYIDRYGRERLRQQRRFNNLFILEQSGVQLEVVGSVENLAPTETIKSVRFLDDVAYVTTFRVVDPLFAIDLSNPTDPTVEGALKIPGFSNYLHPVGEDYVIGIGRDANEITGALGALQLSLFYMGDLTNPVLVDQLTMEGVAWASSEAWFESHAVSYFAEDQVLTIPISYSPSLPSLGLPSSDLSLSISLDRAMTTDVVTEAWFQPIQITRRSAIWAFEIDVDQQGGGSIEVAGQIEHEGTARRSLRVDDALITVSSDYVMINNLHEIDQQLAELYLGPLLEADRFTIQEDSSANTLDVRANDRPDTTGAAPLITGVTQPVKSSYGYLKTINPEQVGTVEISDDGLSLVFRPVSNGGPAVPEIQTRDRALFDGVFEDLQHMEYSFDTGLVEVLAADISEKFAEFDGA